MRALALLCALLGALGAATGIRDLPASDTTPYFAQYANSLMGACQRAQLTATLKAIKAANMTEMFEDTLLSVTFLALDDEAWGDLLGVVRPGKSLDQVLAAEPLFVRQVLEAHMVDYPFFTNLWPPATGGAPPVNVFAQLENRQLRLHRDPLNSDYLVDGFQNSAPLGCSSTDLLAGASVLHVLSLRPGWAGPQA